MSSPPIDNILILCYTYIMFNGTRIKTIYHRKLIYLDKWKTNFLGYNCYKKHDEHRVTVDWGNLTCFYHKYLLVAYIKSILWIIKQKIK